MSDPIVFISHFRVREGKLDAYRALQREITRQLDEEKPRTLAFLAYVDDFGTDMTVVHVFADLEAMNLHFQGSDERSRRAHELLVPNGWEIYGTPSTAVVDELQGSATAAGVPLTIQREHVAGFLRAAPAG